MSTTCTRLHGSDDAASQLRIAQLALDNSLDSILIHDLDGRLVFFNDAAAHTLGYTPEEFAKLGPWEFAGDYSPEERRARMDAIRGAGELTFYSNGRQRNGRRWTAEVRSRWVETAEGPLVVSVSHDVTERVAASEALEHIAFHDQLTGLANRALLTDRLEVAIAAAKRHGHELGIAFIDLDGFKGVNDSLGHEVGDQLLVAFARRLERAVREEDTVARLGGDEFVVLFPRLTSAEDLASLGKQLRERIAGPVTVNGKRMRVAGSLGLALLDRDSDDAKSLLMRADMSMYEAKRETAAKRGHHLRLVS